jgi:hypothetical protein
MVDLHCFDRDFSFFGIVLTEAKGEADRRAGWLGGYLIMWGSARGLIPHRKRG